MSPDRYQPRVRSRPARSGVPVGPLVICLVAFVVLAVLFLLTAGTQNLSGRRTAADAPAHPAPHPSASPAKHRPGVGDKVRDGKFEFVVTSVDCSRTSVGVEHLRRTAHGKFCVVSLSVRNIADQPKYFLGHAQKVVDTAGTTYGNDELAGLYANQNSQTLLRRIGPGQKVTGKLAFDLPAASAPATVELHDSLLSGGVEVAVTA